MSLRRAICLLALTACTVAPGCFLGTERQWTVEFGTNAALGDRLSIEVLDESGRPACDDCAREIDLGDGANDLLLQKGGLSLGITDTGSVVRVRARLFRYKTSASATRSSASAIDVVARLPRITRDADYNIPFPLPLSCLGRPPDLAAGTTCQLDANNIAVEGPEPTLVEYTGKGWKKPPDSGGAIGCTKPAPDGMACVGGGVFLLGDDRYEALAFDYPARPELAISFSASGAILLDIDEMTVGAVRRLVKQGAITAADAGAILRKSATAGAREEACTYLGPDDATNDALPLNCIGRDVAAAVCKARGLRLPSEAEWEFAARNGVEETVYPWGNVDSEVFPRTETYELDDVVCERAIVGRGRDELGESTKCTDGKGPVASGSALDVTKAGVKNLAGNLSEWVAGEFGFYDDPCWQKSNVCLTSSPKLQRRMIPRRGASWARDPEAAVAIARFARAGGEPTPYIGFRCAISDGELP